MNLDLHVLLGFTVSIHRWVFCKTRILSFFIGIPFTVQPNLRTTKEMNKNYLSSTEPLIFSG